MAARGTVVKRGTKWSVVLDFGRDETGRRIRKWHSGFATEKAAEKARTALLGKLDAGEYVASTRITVREFANDRWLPSVATAVATGSLKATTGSSYKMLVERHVLPHLGHVALKDVTPDMLARLYGELFTSGRLQVSKKEGAPTGLSASTVRLIHVCVHRMLSDAVRWGVLARNVADAAARDVPRKQRSSDSMAVWSPEQLRAFLESVAEDRLYCLWHLLCLTGARRGELCGLKWNNVDLDGGRITISESRVVVDFKVMESTPKTERSARAIALDPATVAVLRSHRARQAAERLAWGPEYQDTNLVFVWEDGRPLHPQLVSTTFKRLARAADLPPIKLHALRHSFASAALRAGVPMVVVQRHLGHSSIAVTADIYSHVSRDVDQAATDRVASVILGSGA